MANWTIPYAGLKGKNAKDYLKLSQEAKVIYGTCRCRGDSHYIAILHAKTYRG